MQTADYDSKTRVSLLEALDKGDTGLAWSIFFDKYAKIIHIWCRRWGASVEDSEDVVQETLLMVFRKIAQFQYNPNLSFRAWLKTITHHNWIKILEVHRRSSGCLNGESVSNQLAEASSEFGMILDRIADQEILSLAIARVRATVSELAWHCFEQSSLHDKSGETVAGELGISVNYVHVNVFRVRKMVQDEIRLMDHD